MPNICEPPVSHGSRKCAPLALAVLAASSSQSRTSSVVKDANVYNRAVPLVGNDRLEVAIVKQGGSMLRLQIQGDPQGIGPFGNPELVRPPGKEEAAAGLAMHGEAYRQQSDLDASRSNEVLSGTRIRRVGGWIGTACRNPAQSLA
jgi:hypothetical protein